MICRSQSHLILIESSVPISFVLSCVLPVPCSDGSQVVLDAIDPSRSETANASPPIFKIYRPGFNFILYTPWDFNLSSPFSADHAITDYSKKKTPSIFTGSQNFSGYQFVCFRWINQNSILCSPRKFNHLLLSQPPLKWCVIIKFTLLEGHSNSLKLTETYE